MRYDLVSKGRKSIHVKLSKDIHTALRQKLLGYGLTMQDLFSEVADIALADTDRADRILKKISKRKLQESLQKTGRKLSNELMIGELDSDALYNILDEGRKDSKDDGSGDDF